jgi:CelD/BcsL family acetyltransferase involved in cellulose biosynthesis
MEVARQLGAFEHEWRRLGETSGNLFATWEWAETWWRHFGAGRPLVAVAGDSLVALEIRRRGPLRVARFVGHGPADELGPIGGIELLEALGEQGHWDVLLAERMPPHARPRQLGGRTLQREPSPVVEATEGGFEGFLKARSRNFRSQIRRKERSLVEKGLTYRLSDDPARLDADMRSLAELHQARWGEEGSGALADRRAAFHRDFARRALGKGWLRLWVAEVDGHPVAAWYGFRFAGEEWYYQSGRDPDWDRESVGLVLLAHTIRSAFDDGLTTYRLLRGGESYKDRFATGDAGVETVVAGRTALGRAAERAAPAALRLRRRLRGSDGGPSTTPHPSG